MNDTIQLLIVLAVIVIAFVGLVLNIIKKTQPKNKGCESCPLNCDCKKSSSHTGVCDHIDTKRL